MKTSAVSTTDALLFFLELHRTYITAVVPNTVSSRGITYHVPRPGIMCHMVLCMVLIHVFMKNWKTKYETERPAGLLACRPGRQSSCRPDGQSGVLPLHL